MPPIPWRCAGELGRWVAWVLFLKKGCIWLHDISPLKSLNFANSVCIRDSEGLSAAWRLSSPGWFDIDLPREVVQGPPAICHGIHQVFLPTSGVDFRTLHLGCLLFHVGFFQCFSCEFGPVSHIQSLFQQLLWDSWEHHWRSTKPPSTIRWCTSTFCVLAWKESVMIQGQVVDDPKLERSAFTAP